MITPEVRKFEGYVSPQPQTGQIEGGKVLVIEYLYEREVHTLQLENNDGTEPKQLQMKQGATIPAPSMRKGYTFMGWYTDSTLQNAYTGNMPNEDMTLYDKMGSKYKNLHSKTLSAESRRRRLPVGGNTEPEGQDG